MTGKYLLLALLATAAFAQDPVSITPYQLLDARSGQAVACSGCSIYTYAAGTNTPLATYTSSTLATPNTNPVLTNSAGYAVNGATITGIWVGSSCYKFVAKDSSAVTLFTQDNICDRGAVLKALLAASSGSSLIGYKYSAAATAETVQARLQQYVSVKDFGATGSGSTVDTAAIQATIEATSTAGGGTVYFPKGSYLTSALTMRSDVALVCASGTTFLANDNSEIMFNTGSGVDNTGLIADGGYCNISGNSKTGFQAIGITGGAGASTSNTYRGLIISGAAIGIETTNTYFNLFENIRVIGPTTAAYMFEAATTATKCLNCSAIATTGSPIGFTIHNGGNIVFEGTIEGTLLSNVYQVSGVQLSNVYFENTGSTNAYWLQVGTQTGTFTTGVAISGCSFNVGAQYGIMVEQVTGLSVTGNAFNTSLAAFQIDNTGSVNGAMRGLNVRGNSYNIGGLGYDPTKIYVYTNAAADNLTNNVGDDSSSPLIFSPVTPGTLVTPPDVALSNTQGVSYVDGATGQLRYRYRDNSGTMHQNILITDSTISAIAIGPNIVDNPGGVANAVTATFTDATGTNVPVAAGLHILLHLIGGVSFQAGANTFNLNASGAKAVYQSTNINDLTTAIANGAYVDMIYDGTGWQVLSQ